MGSGEAWRSDLIPWVPSSLDTGQVDESTSERAIYRLLTENLTDEEICARAIRELEFRRVSAEVNRAATMVAIGQLDHQGQPVHAANLQLDLRLAGTMAAMNLMGIMTLLPGEAPLEKLVTEEDSRCIYLANASPEQKSADTLEQVDALSGLIRDFYRSDIILSGLKIVASAANDPHSQRALVAVHPGVLAAFGEFLMRKYVVEGWRLG